MVDNPYSEDFISLSEKNVSKKCVCTDSPFIVFFLINLMLWFFLSIYACATGQLDLLNQLSDSEGNLCRYEKSQVLYQDLSQCGRKENVENCATPHVCVEECPETYWTTSQGKSAGLEKFCADECPSFLVPSITIMEHCVPKFCFQDKREITSEIEKIVAMRTFIGEPLNVSLLCDGTGVLLETIFSDGLLSWFLNNYLITIILICFFAISIGFLCNGCLLKHRRYAWTFTTIVTIPLLIGTLVCSVCLQHSLSVTPILSSLNTSEIFSNLLLICAILISFILLGSFVLIFFVRKKGDLTFLLLGKISEELIMLKKRLFFIIIPTAQSLTQTLHIILSVTVSFLLLTSDSQEYFVVNSCPTESCINSDTSRMFKDGDSCDPDVFSKCTGCPEAQCLQKQMRSSIFVKFCLVFNCITTLFNISLITCFGKMCMVGIFAGVQSSSSKIIKYHLGSLILESFLPFTQLRQMNIEYISYANIIIFGKRIIDGFREISSSNSRQLREIRRLTFFLLFASKICLILISTLLFSMTYKFLDTSIISDHLTLLIAVTSAIIAYIIINNTASVFITCVDAKILVLAQILNDPKEKKTSLRDLLRRQNKPHIFNEERNFILVQPLGS